MALMFHLRRMIPHKECHPCHDHPPLPISEPPKPRNSERAYVSIHEHAHGSMMHLETTARYLVITATSGSCGGLVVNWKTTPETECSSFEALVLVDIQQGRCKCHRILGTRPHLTRKTKRLSTICRRAGQRLFHKRFVRVHDQT